MEEWFVRGTQVLVHCIDSTESFIAESLHSHLIGFGELAWSCVSGCCAYLCLEHGIFLLHF